MFYPEHQFISSLSESFIQTTVNVEPFTSLELLLKRFRWSETWRYQNLSIQIEFNQGIEQLLSMRPDFSQIDALSKLLFQVLKSWLILLEAFTNVLLDTKIIRP